MGKYSDIVNGSWVDMTLYAESIPHLLHWDLAYLWILEKGHLKPESWDERIEAWRYLVGLFILGELEIEEEPIHVPFLAHTHPYGISHISWLRLRNSSQRVGVMSPTVLVRPLPDFKDTDLRQWKKTVSDPLDSRGGELQHFAGLIVRNLREGERGDTFRVKLADILERELKPRTMANPPAGAFQTVQLLDRLMWAQETDGASMEDVSLVVRRVAGGGAARSPLKSYIPYCSVCGQPLTRVVDAPPIVVTGDQLQFDCKNSDCGAANSLDLSNFLIWLRGRNNVVIWEQGILTSLENGFPPVPTVQNKIDVLYEWGPAQVGGDAYRRFLRLRFPEKDITSHRLEEIFFPHLLVPGDPQEFTGLPVRAQWLDAVNPVGHEIALDIERGKVLYSGLDIKGWPERLRWPVAALRLDPSLAVGVYPDPHQMPDEWQLYRTFLAGDSRRGYQLAIDSAREILPWLRESDGGAPSYVSITEGKNQNVGVTYWLNRAGRPLPRVAPTVIYVGVDLGTANTLIYAMSEEQKSEAPDPKVHGVRPSDMHRGVGWLAGDVGTYRGAAALADFLPGPAYGAGESEAHQPDPYIIPSALWDFHQQHVIRWTADPPAAGARAISDFKLDHGGQHLERRRAFLNELFRITLPYILGKHTLSAPVIFRIGFAFPLAFHYAARQDRMKLIREIGDALGNASYRFEFFSTDESHACVRAFGSPNPDDTFLVADMGGGTMDLALFTGRYVLQLNASNDGRARGDGKEGERERPLQIGSVELAGGDFMSALVSKKYEATEERERFYWELRDLITQNRSHEQYGADGAAKAVLDRLTGIAFEFLRTMVAALQNSEPRDEIHLVLVGNGWHLAEAFNSETRSRNAKRVFDEYYDNLVKYLNFPSLRFLNRDDDLLGRLPSSKHLVVIGALENAVNESRADIKAGSRAETLSKLPAGRSMRIKMSDDTYRTRDVPWNELVGEDVPWTGFTEQELHAAEYTFDLDAMPGLTQAWLRYLSNKLKGGGDLPTPAPMALKRALINNIKGSPPKLYKGPLQLIVEGSWKERLKD